MPANEIIAEIHRHREALACECDYDVKKLMAYYRRRETEREDTGQKLVSFVAETKEEIVCDLREEPPKPK